MTGFPVSWRGVGTRKRSERRVCGWRSHGGYRTLSSGADTKYIKTVFFRMERICELGNGRSSRVYSLDCTRHPCGKIAHEHRA
jgi:hypothetical protein